MSVKFTGSGAVAVVDTLNPNSVVPPAAMSAFQEAPFAVAFPLATLIVDDHADDNWCPAGKSHTSCHARTASALPFAIFTFAVKPPFHVLGLEYVTVQAPGPLPVRTPTAADAGEALPAESSATTVKE